MNEINENKNSGSSGLKRSFKTSIIILTVAMLIMTVFFAAVLSVLIGSFNAGGVGLGHDDIARRLRLIRVIAMLAGPVIAVLSGISLYRSYKQKEALMRETEPIECVVKDFLITSYYRQHKRRYSITPVLEDVKTGELYCSFGSDNMSFYSTTYSYIGGSLNIGILRSDGSKVELGDTARVYIKQPVNMRVETDGNKFAFDGRWREFGNVNQAYGMQMVYSLRFFKGIVDVERY